MKTKVESLKCLVELALQRKCVTGFGQSERRMPAAFLVNMPAIIVHRALERGIFIYVPKIK